ncbi:unnamed protein product [Kluyveromyces dobzhanskii CBS 2104]|uniref:WGS project CCBQ000000000 data, contig 00099 n=1 Tax=Kluyveromyces dobzhanskii CBS 2104 TaxID=1427455 RepID=A0A0A8L519_9SACH|nr:unnamed protein product [Kluyveromyces dobzhanskii CBS 2104]
MSAQVIPYNDSDIVELGSDVTKPDFPQLSESHSINEQRYYVTEDTPLNKRNFLYQPCAANLMLDKLKYCGTEYSDNGSINLMDRSDKLSFSLEDHSISVSEDCGWRSIRSEVCVKEGKVYWEVEMKNVSATAHIRCGISRREASTETPVGCDFYGYSVKDKGLQVIHEGRLQTVLKPNEMRAGDRIGFLLTLPSLQYQNEQAAEYSMKRIQDLSTDHNGANKRGKKPNTEFYKFLLRECDPTNVIRDQIAIRYKNQLFYESTDYVKTTKPEYYDNKNDTPKYFELENSNLEVFVNGVSHGIAFTGLTPFLPPFSELQYNEKFYLHHWNRRNTTKGIEIRNKYVDNNRLGYYPTLSSFQGGTASIITEASELQYLPTDPDIKTLHDIYKEQIASDIVWDLIDEIDS